MKELKAVRGNETILVVEDEEAVRDLTVRVLQSLGYAILDAARADEALEICRNRTEPIHLVLTDMIMPRMSGKQLIEELQKFRNDFKVLFISGYGSEDTVDGMAIGANTPLIQKPFKPDALGRKVREILDS